jgi:NitT/TauT family transport system substrate-binding protein
MSVNALYRIISSPDFVFTIAPENIMKFATFMHKIGSLKHQPSSWKGVYFPEIHDQPGS